MRLTRTVREQLLAQNDGFETQTSYRSKNFRESRRYRISGGQLLVQSSGKGAWGGSQFRDEFVADDAQTHRFLRENLERLNTSGLD